jgi:hypothetical protein
MRAGWRAAGSQRLMVVPLRPGKDQRCPQQPFGGVEGDPVSLCVVHWLLPPDHCALPVHGRAHHPGSRGFFAVIGTSCHRSDRATAPELVVRCPPVAAKSPSACSKYPAAPEPGRSLPRLVINPRLEQRAHCRLMHG